MGYADRDRRSSRDARESLLAAAAQLQSAAGAPGRVPPHDLEAERAVLGGILLDNGGLATVESILVAGDFYHPAHAVLFEAMHALSARREPVDVVTLASELRARERLNTIGGAQYLGELTDTIPTIAHIEVHARIVADLAGVRKMIQVAHEIVARGFGDRGTAEEFLDFAAAKVFEVAQKRSKSTLISLEQAITEAFERLEKSMAQGVAITGTPTGFQDLDRLIAGMSGGQLIVLAARPAMGKCLARDAEIVLEDGRVVTLEEVVRARSARLLTLRGDGTLGIASPSDYVDDGHKPVFRVTTGLGRQVTTTLTHPFLTADGWRPLGELSPGARIGVPRRIPVQGRLPLRPEAVHLLAQGLAEALPAAVFTLPQEPLALFLSRLFAADGWATVSVSGRAQVGYATGCERIARQVQHLLLRFGVLAALKAAGEGRARWEVEVTDPPSLRAFCRQVGILGREAAVDRVSRAVAHLQEPGAPALGDVYWDEVVSIEPLGYAQVYDLTVPETHNFVADDVCVHNTSLVMNLTENAALATARPVLFFSLEMPRVELANRLLCGQARVDQSRLRSNLLTSDDLTALTQAASRIYTLPIYIDDSGDLTLMDLRSKARKMKAERDLSLIIVDYLQLMKASREKSESREREISEISRGLKALAKELDVPIVALSQLNRACETRPGKDKRPMLADLRESGAIEQDADVVMFIYRDEVYNRDTEDKGIAEIIVAKQRNGPTDTVRLRFIRELTRFENLAADEHGYADAQVSGDDVLPDEHPDG